MNAPHRRGACPGLSAPMPTGDGLLVRLLPGDPIGLDAFVGLCEAARRHGNGTVEVSRRGSLQVRGLTPDSAPRFAAAVTALDIGVDDGAQVLSGPLDDGADAVDTRDLAAALRRAVASARLVLSPKISIVVDGGGRLHLDALTADVRLRAVGPAAQPRFCVGLGGDGASATWIGSVSPGRAVDAVIGILALVAARGPSARAADVLRDTGTDGFGSLVDLEASAPPHRQSAEMIGCHPLRDGDVAIGIALAFGQADADALAVLARSAAACGAGTIMPALQRSLMMTGLARSRAADLASAAARLGFVVSADDPRRRIAACPGAPACRSGLIPARRLAEMLVPQVARTTGDVTVHVSGCRKGCADPNAAALTVIGTDRGCGIIHDGSSRTEPEYHVDMADLAGEIDRIADRARRVAHG